MNILKTENLSHKYGSSWAIRDINLEIAQTGIIGLLGSNGAGKSTTMNIVCGTLKQSAGKVFIDGIDLQKRPEEAKKLIGFLPQQPPVYVDFTVDEYLRYAARLRLMDPSKISNAVEEVKEKCQLQHFSNRLIKNLSGGYRQRVGIAQAIIHNPKLVVMDEPTNGLDPNQLIEARKLIKEIGKDRAVLLSSHIMTEINLLCNNVVMIEGGRIIFSDTMGSFNNFLQKQTLILKFANPPEISILKKVPGILSVEELINEEFRIHFNNKEGLSERIINASISNNWQLLEFYYEKQILDDVFQQLSTTAKR